MTHLALPSLLGMLLSAYLAGFILIRRPGQLWGRMLLVTLFLFIWISGQFFFLIYNDPYSIVMISKYQYLGILFQPASWYFYAWAESGRHSSNWNLLVLVVPVICLIFALTYTEGDSNLLWHGFLYPPEVPVSKTIYGPLFWINAINSFLLIAAGSLLLFNHYSQSPFYRAHLTATVAIPLLILVLNGCYLAGIWPLPVDPTPTGFALALVLFGWAMHKRRFLDLTPITRSKAFDALDDAVFILDYRDRIVDFNPVAKTLSDRSANNLIGEAIQDVFDQQINPCMTGESYHFSFRDRTDLEVKVSRSNVDEKLRGKVLIIRDVSDEMETRRQLLDTQVALLKSNEDLHRIASTDELTGLSNRRSLIKKLEDEIARSSRTGHQLAVLFIDLDHFKTVNDRYGHRVGDDVLQSVAKKLLKLRRGQDIAARYGGEELALIIADTHREGAISVAVRLCEELGKIAYISQNREEFKVTASIGISLATAEDKSTQPLLDRADQALYYAKNHGRNCVAIANDPGFQIVTLN